MVGDKPNELFNDLTQKIPYFSDQSFITELFIIVW